MNAESNVKTAFRWKKLLAWVAAVMLTLLLFIWLVLPGIVQSQAQQFIQEKTGHRLSLARPEINPLNLRVRLSALELRDPEDKSLLSFDELVIDLSWASLPMRAWMLDDIRLAGAKLVLTQSGDQRLNWSTIFDALSGPKTTSEPAALPRLNIARLEVTNAEIDFADRRSADGFTSRITPIDLQLTDLTTIRDEHGRATLTARLNDGAQISMSVEADLTPIALSGEFAVKDLALSTIRTYVKEALPAPPGGQLALKTRYRVENTGTALAISLNEISLNIDQLRIPLTAAADSYVATESLAIEGGSFDITTQEVALQSVTISDTELHLPGVKHTPRLAKLMVSEVTANLAKREASVSRIALNNGAVRATRNNKGAIDLAQALAALKANQPPAKPATETPAPAWRYELKALALEGWSVGMSDESAQPAADFALTQLAIALDGLSNDLAKPVPLRVTGNVGEAGRLTVSGTVIPAAPSLDLKVALTDLGLSMLRPYVEHYTHLTPAKGRFGTEGTLQYSAKGPSYQGGFSLHDLQMNITATGERVLAWNRFDTKSLRASDTRLDIGQLNLVGLDTRLIIEKDKTVNVSRIVKKSTNEVAVPEKITGEAGSGAVANATPAQPAAAPPPAEPSTTTAPPSSVTPVPPPFLVSIASLRFEDCELDFADRSLVLPFGTRIHEMHGRINGLSNRPGSRGQLELDGAVDDFGLARAAGEIDLSDPTGYTDIAVSFRNVDMPRLSPYTATAAGRRIESGKLSLELRYSIKNRQLQAQNQVIIDRLVLGERVESPTAVDLPLSLAIALLEDSDGRIDLGLPISGNLDDPQFSYGHIIWKAITNILTKIVTSPFRAIGALFGSDEALDAVAFEAGSAKLAPPEQEKLVRVSSAIAKRPKLSLSVRGLYAPEDHTALQDEQLRRTLLAAMGDPVAPDVDPGPVAIDNPKVRSELESLYSKRKGSNELAALKEGFRQANPGQLEESPTRKLMSRLTGLMSEKKTLSESETAQLAGKNFWSVLYERVRTTESVSDERLMALAAARGNYAQEQLKRLGVAPDRMRLEPAKSGQAGDNGIPLELIPVPVAASAQ